MAKRPNVIENVSYERRLIDSVFGFGDQMQAYLAYQTVWMDELTGSAVEQAEQAAEAFDTTIEAGSPNLDSDLEIKAVRMRLEWDGAAMGLVIWGREDNLLLGGGRLPRPTRWSSRRSKNIRRYLYKNDPTQFALVGQLALAGISGPASQVVPISGALLFVQETATQSFDADIVDEEAGTFVNASGVNGDTTGKKVMRLVSDVKEYTIGNHKFWVRTRVYQQWSSVTTGKARGGQVVDPWEDHTVDASMTVRGVNLRTG